MSDHNADLIIRYRDSGILLDANILLLYFVGRYKRSLITQSKKLSAFIEEDYDFLIELLEPVKKLITTPNILTEVSNLSNNDRLGPEYFDRFAQNVSLLTEEYFQSEDIVKMPGFTKFHLTDTGIVESARGKYLVMTVDFDLFGYLWSQNVEAVNFNHIRPFYW